MYKLPTFVIAAAAIQFAHLQAATLTGAVSDGSHHPIAGAQIVARPNQSEGAVLTMQTGYDGQYQLSLESGASYQVTVSKPGLRSVQAIMTVSTTVLEWNCVLQSDSDPGTAAGVGTVLPFRVADVATTPEGEAKVPRSRRSGTPNTPPPLSDLPPFLLGRTRAQLDEIGISVRFEKIFDYLANPTGGVQQRNTLFGRLTGMLDIDMDKLAGWTGASFHVNGIYQYGTNLSYDYIRSFDFTSSVAGAHTFRLNEYYYQQKFFGGRFAFRIGQIASQNEFNNQYIGANAISGFTTWVNNTLCCNPPTTFQAYLPYTPAAKPSFVIQAEPTKKTFAKIAISAAPRNTYQGDPSGLAFDLRDAPVLATEYGYKLGGDESSLSGIYTGGVLYNFGRYRRFGTQAYTRGNYIGYFDAGQTVYRKRSASGKPTNQTLDLQFSITAGPRIINDNDLQVVGGVRYVGLFPRRRNDTIGFGGIWAHFSQDESKMLIRQGFGPKTWQTNYEFVYKFVLTPFISLWPDFQYIQRPNGNSRVPDAPVLGLRLVLDF